MQNLQGALHIKPTRAALHVHPNRAASVDYPFFDWLRFALASAVALNHAGVPGINGNLAVQVFFALSGWLISGILLRSRPADLPRFFYNRATRIWLPYFAAVAALYGLATLKEGGFTPRFLIHDVTFTHNWFIQKVPAILAAMPMHGSGAGFWSIAVEEQFYLIAPLLIVLSPWGRKLEVWMLIALLACVSDSWYAAISLGVFASLARERFGDWHLVPRARAVLAVLTTLVFAATRLPQAYDYAAPIFAVCVVWLCAVPGSRSSLAMFLGGVSYPLYLNHWMGAFVAHALVGHAGLAVRLASYAFGLTAGVIAYLLVDRPVMAWRGALFTELRGRACTATAYALMALGLTFGLVR